MAISIKQASPKDAITIRHLAIQTWWPTYSPILAKDQIEYMLEAIYSEEILTKSIQSGAQTFLILEDNETPVGFGSYGSWTEDSSKWKIHKLYVLPSLHKTGYGTQLLNGIIERAHKSEITNIVLNVNRQNPALTFYQKMGFKILREEDIPIGPYWMNDYVMQIDITR
jgi:diamine N-acetyltransferase